MHNSTKGLLAATAGGVLLLGGAGSLAFWTDSASIAGGTINSGRLTLTDSTSGTCAAAGWVIDSAEEPAGVAFNPATQTLVPGDVITKQCTYTVGAEGTHLRAALEAAGGAATGDLAPALSVSGSFTVDGAAVAEITEANDGDVLGATISIEFDPSSGNGTQIKTADLSDYVVSLTQVHD